MQSVTVPGEDSGIIDLKALAAKAESMRAPALSEIKEGAAPVEAAPAQFAAPLGGYAPIDSEVAPKSRLPFFFGLGAGILLLLVAGILIGFKAGSGVASAPVATGAAPAIPIPTVVATSEPSAAASISATAEPSASAPPEEVATTPKPRRHKHKLPAGGEGAGATPGDGAGASGAAATTHAAAGAGAAQTAPPAKKGDCGCKGDLICMMKCSTH